MSTVKKNTILHRFAKIAVLNEAIFHIDDLANLWGIKNENTLHTTLKRYVKQGLLFRIYRGFYSIKPVDKLDPYLLGLKAIYGHGYISTETVLISSGIIQQSIGEITLISSKSIRFSIGGNNYRSRMLADKYLYNPAGIKEKNGIKIASMERAIADLLYFNPKTYFDAGNLINWKKVKKIQKEIGYDFTKQKRRNS